MNLNALLKRVIVVILIFCLEAPDSLWAQNFARPFIYAPTRTFQEQALSPTGLWETRTAQMLPVTPLHEMRRAADEESTQLVRAVYNESANAYLSLRGAKVPAVVKPTLDTFLNLLPSQGPVLDIGTGPGTYAAAVAEHFRERGIRRRVIGIDMAENMTVLAKEQHATLMAEVPLEFHAMHSRQIRGQLRSERLAGIIDVGSLHFSPSEEAENQTFRDYFDALSDGGVLFLYERLADEETTQRTFQPHPQYGGQPIPYNRYAMEDLIGRLVAAGFEVLREYCGVNPHATKPEKWVHIIARRPATGGGQIAALASTSEQPASKVGPPNYPPLDEIYAGMTRRFQARQPVRHPDGRVTVFDHSEPSIQKIHSAFEQTSDGKWVLQNQQPLPVKTDIYTSVIGGPLAASVAHELQQYRDELLKAYPPGTVLYLPDIDAYHMSLVLLQDMRAEDRSAAETLFDRRENALSSDELGILRSILRRVVERNAPYELILRGLRVGYDGSIVAIFDDPSGTTRRIREDFWNEVQKLTGADPQGRLLRDKVAVARPKDIIGVTLTRMLSDLGGARLDIPEGAQERLQAFEQLKTEAAKLEDLRQADIRLRVDSVRFTHETRWMHAEVDDEQTEDIALRRQTPPRLGSDDFLLSQAPPVAVRPGLDVIPLKIEGPALAAGGEMILIDLKRFKAVQRWSEDLRYRDLFDDPFVPGDQRTGHTIPEWATQEADQEALVLSLNSTQGWFTEPNTLLIVNGQLIWREPGKRGVGQKTGYQPPNGRYSILSLDPDKPGVFEIEIKDGAVMGDLPVQNGFGGPRLLRGGQSTLDQLKFNPGAQEGFHAFGIKGLDQVPLSQRSGNRTALAGDDLSWGSPDDRKALVLYGYTPPDAQGHRRLAIVLLSGDPADSQKREPAIRHAIQVLQSMGITDAIFGGSSEDLQRLFNHGELPFFSGQAREESILRRLLNRNGLRPIGTVLHFFDRSEIRHPVRPWQSSVAGVVTALAGIAPAAIWTIGLIAARPHALLFYTLLVAALATIIPLVIGSLFLTIAQPVAVLWTLMAGQPASPSAVISPWRSEGIVDVIETDPAKDIAFVDGAGDLHANLGSLGHLPRWLQRSILTHEITHKRRVLAQIAEGKSPPQRGWRYWGYRIREEAVAYYVQLFQLSKDIHHPERPVPIDVIGKMVWDQKLQTPEAFLPPIPELGVRSTILGLARRTAGLFRFALTDHRTHHHELPNRPWHGAAKATNYRDLNFPFDANGFYFGKDRADWEIARLAEVRLAGADYTLRLNRGPIGRYHSMLVPNKAENQFFRDRDAQALVEFLGMTEDPIATVCYQSLFAGASQNSKHLHVRYEKFSTFSRGMRVIAQEAGVEVGILNRAPAWLYWLAKLAHQEHRFRDYPAGTIRLRSTSPEELGKALAKVTRELNRKGIPFGLAARQGDILISPVLKEVDEQTRSGQLGYDLSTADSEVGNKEEFLSRTEAHMYEVWSRVGMAPADAETLAYELFGPPRDEHSDSVMSDNDLVPIFDGGLREHIGYRRRADVHAEGDYHQGAQAYVVREGEGGKLQVLVQRRSGAVDISRGKYDQSLATQMIKQDELDVEKTLIRGMKTELNVDEKDMQFVQIGRTGWLRVIKKYEEQPDVDNRELISLFLVKVRPGVLRAISPKVVSLQWMDWDDYVRGVRQQPERFTKTARFYVVDPVIRQMTEKAIGAFLRGEPIDPFPVRRDNFFSYGGRYDVSIVGYHDWSLRIFLYDNQTHRSEEIDDVISFDTYPEGQDRRIIFRFTRRDGTNYSWEDGQVRPTGRRADPASLAKIEAILKRFEKEIKEAENHADLGSRLELAAMELRITRNLRILWSRILAGDVVLSDDVSLGVGDTILPAGSDPVTLIDLMGTFDPGHLGHVDAVLDAYVHASAQARGQRRIYVGVMDVLGDHAPGPDGETGDIWKLGKNTWEDRYEITSRITHLFEPLIVTSRTGIDKPSGRGIENALHLIDRNHLSGASRPVILYLACGADTFMRWRATFDRILKQAHSRMPNVEFRIFTRDDPNYPVPSEALQGFSYPVDMPQRHLASGLHSTDLRKGAHWNLLTQSAREYIAEHRLYQYPPLNPSQLVLAAAMMALSPLGGLAAGWIPQVALALAVFVPITESGAEQTGERVGPAEPLLQTGA